MLKHSRVRLIDADGKTLAIGPKQLAKELKEGDILDKITEKDGIVTEMKLAEEKDDEDPEDPGDPEEPEEITATAELERLMGATRVKIAVEGVELDEVTNVIINDKAAARWEVRDGTVQALTSGTVESVKIVVDGTEYPVEL